MSNKPPLIVRHRGPLTLSSLGNSLPAQIFRPRSKNPSDSPNLDPYQLGWECVPPFGQFLFKFGMLPFATAEGAATLAAIVECLRRKTGADVEVDMGLSKNWAQAIGVDQVASGRWSPNHPDSPSVAQGCYAYPVWRVDLNSRERCSELSTHITHMVRELPEGLLDQIKEEVVLSLELVARESILNVFEHAYQPDEPRFVFGALTVTPFPRREDLGVSAYACPEEMDWFDLYYASGVMLEVALVDYGHSVPFTLWRDLYKSHAELFYDIGRLNLGTKAGQRARAELHHKISLWAFNHNSTRKEPRDFVDELARYNWRGLSRSLNSAARLNACVVMRSGQARTGYAYSNHVGRVLTFSNQSHREFPGTALIFRFPLRPLEWASPSRSYAAPAKVSLLNIKGLVSCEDVGEGMESAGTLAESAIVGVVFPFVGVEREGMSEMLMRLRRCPPHEVLLQLLCYPAKPAVLDDLRAFSSGISVLDVGVPRIVGFWAPDQRILWRFVGGMPESVRSLISQLEQVGVAYFEEGGEESIFAEQIARVYGGIFSRLSTSIRFLLVDSEVDPSSGSCAGNGV